MRETTNQKWSLSQEAFHRLLVSLDADHDSAAQRYLEIRRNLVRLFEWRGCSTPEEYADEAINRCARRISEGEQVRDVATYCIGIARMLLREMSHDRFTQPRSLTGAPEPKSMPAQSDTETEYRLECLRDCLAQLSPENREFILNYYQGDKCQKIQSRRELMNAFEVPASTLRMRALRIRERLQRRMEKCLQRRTGKSVASGFARPAMESQRH